MSDAKPDNVCQVLIDVVAVLVLVLLAVMAER